MRDESTLTLFCVALTVVFACARDGAVLVDPVLAGLSFLIVFVLFRLVMCVHIHMINKDCIFIRL